MKLNKKTIIIAIVVAVVAFLLWKRMKAKSAVGVETEETVSNGTNTSSIDSILSAIGATSSEIANVRRTASAIDASPSWTERVVAKAKKNGITFQQQVVCEAIWMLYHPNGSWIAANGQSADRGGKLTNKVLALY